MINHLTGALRRHLAVAINNPGLTRELVDKLNGLIDEVNTDGAFDRTVVVPALATVAEDGSHVVALVVPDEFVSLVSIDLYGAPVTPGSASASVHLSSEYAGPGEQRDADVEIDQTLVVDLSVAGRLVAVDLTSVVSKISGGDVVRITVDHQTIGCDVDYTSARLVYSPLEQP